MSNKYLKYQERTSTGKCFIWLGVIAIIFGIAEAAGRVSLLSAIPVLLGVEPIHFITIGIILIVIGILIAASATAAK